ncbi:ATP-binding protein [Kitasatospora sp. NPDC048239]|uniref:ATP-binding protein n=1 Tax=Kitasatospora sp. NPDC048239 TaxID=3364046 RepID=UPI00371FD7C4
MNILLSELVTNACRHARTPRDCLIGVRCLVLDSALLRVEVTDASEDLPQPRRSTPDDESGRGLELVTALADSWGAHLRGDGYIGKTVWFQLKLWTPVGRSIPCMGQ